MTEAIGIDLDTAAQLLKLIDDFERSKREGEVISFDDAVVGVASAFGVEDVESTARDFLSGGIGIAFDGDSSGEIARIMAGMCMPVGRCIADYAAGNSSPAALFDGINKIYLENANQLVAVIQKSLGFDIPPEIMSIFEKYSINAVSVYCFAAAYKIYRQAAEDAKLACERRVEIERLCAESISHLKARRAEMETLVDGYLLSKLSVFADGVFAIDQAVLENDDEGYIAAHVDLWRLFGRGGQYESVEEFEDLMLSDGVFKL